MERDGAWLQPLWLSRGRHLEPWSRRAQGTLRSVPPWKGSSRCRTHCLAKQAPPGLSRHLPMATALMTSPLRPEFGPSPGDESQDGASDEPIENDKAPKRRRRGSRGGRGRRGATVVLVDGSEGPEGEEAVPAPVPVLEMEGLEVERSPAPAVAATVAGATVLAGRPEAVVTVKPRIGDTRPGSPPAPPKRRARKEVAPPAQTGGPLADEPGGAELGDADDAATKARRPRRRRSVPGDVGPLAHSPERTAPDKQAPDRPSVTRQVGAAGASVDLGQPPPVRAAKTAAGDPRGSRP